MPRRPKNALLAGLLVDAGWSSGELARAVNAQGALHGVALRYDRTSVAHWLAGSRPRPPVPGLAAASFSQRLGRAVTAYETGLAVPPDAPEPAGDTPADASRRLLDLLVLEGDPVAGAGLRGVPFSPADAAAPRPWALPPGGRARAAEPGAGRAVAADAECLAEAAQAFAALGDRMGGVPVRGALLAYVRDAAGHLLTAGASAPVRRDILLRTAQLAHLLARVTTESGWHGLAQHYFDAAAGLAREGGDQRQFAITLRAMSLQALAFGHEAQAHHLAEAALAALGPRAEEPATRSFLHGQHALTLAVRGDRQRAVTELLRAEHHHAHATAAPGPFSSYPRAGLEYQRARVLHVLGDEEQAVSALRSAAAHRAPEQRHPYALVHARLAEAQLRVGYLEEACASWHVFLDQYAHLRSAQVDRALRRLRQRLRSFPGHPQAREALDRAGDLARTGRAPFAGTAARIG
ncbi:hypothetical protein ABT160_09325 [Streptomyces sp. NPDC001941]|uniref:hypothetical protein n=1 Tax=Streptomyces sp. NPDC001941 TaxID=3154659 RepID=UPI0033327BBF